MRIRRYSWFQVIDTSQLTPQELAEYDADLDDEAREWFDTRRIRSVRGHLVDAHTGEILLGGERWYEWFVRMREMEGGPTAWDLVDIPF